METIREIGADLPVYRADGWRLRVYMVGDAEPDEYVRKLTVAEARSLFYSLPDPLDPDEPLLDKYRPCCLPFVAVRAQEGIPELLNVDDENVLHDVMAGRTAAATARIGGESRSRAAIYRDRDRVRNKLHARNIKGAVAKALALDQLQMPPVVAKPEIATMIGLYGLGLSALEAEKTDIQEELGFDSYYGADALLEAGRAAVCGTVKATTAQAIGQAFAQGLFVAARPYGQGTPPEPLRIRPRHGRVTIEDRLSAEQKEAIRTARLADMTLQEIADAQHISPSTIRRLLIGWGL